MLDWDLDHTLLPLLLLPQVGRLAAEGCYDYCVIESTGIGEPMQVGECGREGKGAADGPRAQPGAAVVAIAGAAPSAVLS